MFKTVNAIKQYCLSRSVISNKITCEEVWNVWKDVNNWPSWDKGLETCKLEGKFAVGESFSLKPINAPMSLTTTILEIKENSMFKDSTKMPLGTIEVTHEVIKTNEGVKLTHSIKADVFEDKIQAFENGLWLKWQNGLQNSVNNIVEIIEESKKNTPISSLRN